MNCTIFVAAVSKVCTIEKCENVTVSVAANQLRIGNCVDSLVHSYNHFEFKLLYTKLDFKKQKLIYFYHISDLFILICLNKPFSKISLNSNMQLFFLIRCKSCFLNFLLYFLKVLDSLLKSFLIVLWT